MRRTNHLQNWASSSLFKSLVPFAQHKTSKTTPLLLLVVVLVLLQPPRHYTSPIFSSRTRSATAILFTSIHTNFFSLRRVKGKEKNSQLEKEREKKRKTGDARWNQRWRSWVIVQEYQSLCINTQRRAGKRYGGVVAPTQQQQQKRNRDAGNHGGEAVGKEREKAQEKSCSNSHYSPGTFYIVDFRERVNVHQPQISPLRVGHHQRVKKRFASSQLSKFHLELSEPADQVDI